MQGLDTKRRNGRKMNNRKLKPILEQMTDEKTGFTYEGLIPNGIKKIMRVSTQMLGCTEVVFENLEEGLLKQIVSKNGLNYEKKKRASEFGCGCVAKLFERIHELDDTNTCTITKPRRFWFSAIIADVVDNSVRVYDSKEAVEIAAELIEQYLEGKILHW